MKALVLACLGLTLALPLAAQTPEALPEKAPDATPRLAYGLLMKQGDKVVFSPCRDRSYAIVEDVSGDGRVLAGLQQVGLEAGKKLYVELLGITDGLALKASGLNLARTDGRCQQPGGEDEAWQAAGSDWVMVAGGERVTLRRAGRPDQVFPYREFTRNGEVASYRGELDGQTLSVKLERQSCQDPAAQAVFGWRAQVALGAQVLKGCAWQR